MTASPVAFRPTTRSLYAPSFEEVARLFEQGDLVPVYRTLPADLETPVSVYLKLAQAGEASFLLESVEGGEQLARYSFLGVNPQAIISARGKQISELRDSKTTTTTLPSEQDALDAIKAIVERYKPVILPNLPRFVGGAVGFLSYDIVRQFERLPETAIEELNVPDASFMLVDTLVMFDHVKNQLIVLSNAHKDGNEGNEGDPRAAYDAAIQRIEAVVERVRAPLPLIPESGPVSESVPVSNFTQEEFEDCVLRAKEYIAAGDAFQIVFSQRMTRETSAHPFAIYRSLRSLNPSPYMFFLHFPADNRDIIGASPEMLVRLDADTRTAMVARLPGLRRAARIANPTSNTKKTCWPTRKSARNTSCWLTWAATTWAVSAIMGRCVCRR